MNFLLIKNINYQYLHTLYHELNNPLNALLVGPAAHKRLSLVVAKQRLHLVVFLQLGIHDDGVDTALDAVFMQVFKHQHGYSTLLIFRQYTHNQSFECVVFLQGFQNVEETEGEQASVGFLHRL